MFEGVKELDVCVGVGDVCCVVGEDVVVLGVVDVDGWVFVDVVYCVGDC